MSERNLENGAVTDEGHGKHAAAPSLERSGGEEGVDTSPKSLEELHKNDDHSNEVGYDSSDFSPVDEGQLENRFHHAPEGPDEEEAVGPSGAEIDQADDETWTARAVVVDGASPIGPRTYSTKSNRGRVGNLQNTLKGDSHDSQVEESAEGDTPVEDDFPSEDSQDEDLYRKDSKGRRYPVVFRGVDQWGLVANSLAILVGVVAWSTAAGMGLETWVTILTGLVMTILTYVVASRWEDTAFTRRNKVQAAVWGILLVCLTLAAAFLVWSNGVQLGINY